MDKLLCQQYDNYALMNSKYRFVLLHYLRRKNEHKRVKGL